MSVDYFLGCKFRSGIVVSKSVGIVQTLAVANNFCMMQGAQPGALWRPRGVGGSFRRGDLCTLTAGSRSCTQKPTQHCKAVIFQLNRGETRCAVGLPSAERGAMYLDHSCHKEPFFLLQVFRESTLDSASSLRIPRLFSLQFTLHSSARSNGLKPQTHHITESSRLHLLLQAPCLPVPLARYSSLLALPVALHLQSAFLGFLTHQLPLPSPASDLQVFGAEVVLFLCVFIAQACTLST